MKPIKYVVYGCRWFDRINGNTYHSVRVSRCADGAVLACPMTYGYGDHYRQTALLAMLKAGWFDNIRRKPEGKPTKDVERYTEENIWYFERENDYPISWNVSDGLKRDCVRHGTL